MWERILQDGLPWLYALLLSVWGGAVQYATRVRNGEPARWSDLFLDIVICSFAGLVAFFICNAFGVDGWRMAIVVSISAHEGTRAIGLMSSFRDRFIGGTGR